MTTKPIKNHQPWNNKLQFYSIEIEEIAIKKQNNARYTHKSVSNCKFGEKSEQTTLKVKCGSVR